jgi:hypothetical protein
MNTRSSVVVSLWVDVVEPVVSVDDAVLGLGSHASAGTASRHPPIHERTVSW